MNALFQHRTRILSTYDGKIPLSFYLKQYFRQYPVLGSRDRRLLTATAYSHYRAAKAVGELSDDKKQLTAELILCEQDGTEYFRMIELPLPAPEGNSVQERVEFLKQQGIFVDLSKLVPENEILSEGVSVSDWIDRLLGRTAVFIKPEKGFEKEVIKNLEKNQIEYIQGPGGEIKLRQGINLPNYLKPQSYRIQDWASQEVVSFLPQKAPSLIWDVCAGAGGKSLILNEKYPKARLLVSDVRASILINLEERFKLLNRKIPRMLEIDLTQLPQGNDPLHGEKADLIICDVPCSGSGTWGRTPEQAFFFKSELLQDFCQKQKEITIKASEFLAPGGKLFYITCSIFRNENENNVQEICDQTDLKLVHQTVINGFKNQADCLFIAELSNT
jgi:16S rRNA (cytosine967-C5)-methyltransferase